MKLHEYQAKKIFSDYGIPIPRGRVATTPQEAWEIAQELGGRVVVKAQVLVGGRGKAGGIQLAKSASEAEAMAASILAMSIKGLPVHKVLVDAAVDIRSEIYLGLTSDRTARRPVMMASSAGGMDIEEVAVETPEKIIREHIDPLRGLSDYQARNIAAGIELPREHWRAFGEIAAALYRTYSECDATLAEINPLVVTGHASLLALDGKVVIDDNALFRHPDMAELRDVDEEVPEETLARKYGLSYVKLDGNIGIMTPGAGLAMASMDIIHYFGGRPANFLDIGGGATAEKVAAALRIILSDPSVQSVLLNIFGGITRCDEVARGILAALDQVPTSVPLVVRLVGTNQEGGRRLLAEANVITATSLAEAAQKAVETARERSGAAVA